MPPRERAGLPIGANGSLGDPVPERDVDRHRLESAEVRVDDPPPKIGNQPLRDLRSILRPTDLQKRAASVHCHTQRSCLGDPRQDCHVARNDRTWAPDLDTSATACSSIEPRPRRKYRLIGTPT